MFAACYVPKLMPLGPVIDRRLEQVELGFQQFLIDMYWNFDLRLCGNLRNNRTMAVISSSCVVVPSPVDFFNTSSDLMQSFYFQ